MGGSKTWIGVLIFRGSPVCAICANRTYLNQREWPAVWSSSSIPLEVDEANWFEALYEIGGDLFLPPINAFHHLKDRSRAALRQIN